jgi:hypothetical protein
MQSEIETLAQKVQKKGCLEIVAALFFVNRCLKTTNRLIFVLQYALSQRENEALRLK